MSTRGSGSLSPAAGASAAAPEVEGHWAPHGAVLTACVVGSNVLVIEESTPVAKDILCARSPSDPSAADCMAVHRAVLTARIQKISARERSRWM